MQEKHLPYTISILSHCMAISTMACQQPILILPSNNANITMADGLIARCQDDSTEVTQEYQLCFLKAAQISQVTQPMLF